MDIGSIFLILALLVLVVLYISRPFFEREAQPVAEEVTQAEHERSSLLAERDRLLNALQELDFDHALGKIPAEDYPEQRQRLLHTGADVLRRLDVIQPQADAEDAETRLEAAIAERRADARRAEAGVQAAPVVAGARKSAVATAGADDDLEKLLADRRRQRREKAAGFCSQCGGPVHKSDRFCPKCGGKIT